LQRGGGVKKSEYWGALTAWGAIHIFFSGSQTIGFSWQKTLFFQFNQHLQRPREGIFFRWKVEVSSVLREG
jgi:hypothetical protein